MLHKSLFKSQLSLVVKLVQMSVKRGEVIQVNGQTCVTGPLTLVSGTEWLNKARRVNRLPPVDELSWRQTFSSFTVTLLTARKISVSYSGFMQANIQTLLYPPGCRARPWGKRLHNPEIIQGWFLPVWTLQKHHTAVPKCSRFQLQVSCI